MLTSKEAAKQARRSWRNEPDRGQRLWSVLAYANARWRMACRLGDTPTCGKWRNFVSALEASLTRASNQIDELATAQSFEYAPSAKSKKDNMANTALFMGDRRYRYVEHPHLLPEIAGDTDPNEDYVYDPDDIPEYKPASTWRSTWRSIVTERAVPDQEDEQHEAPSLWIVRAGEGYQVFYSHEEAVEAARNDVEDGEPRAIVYSTKVSTIVEAVVQRTIVVSTPEQQKPPEGGP